MYLKIKCLNFGLEHQPRFAWRPFGQGVINGRVSYIDPQLNEETRTGRVRIEVANENERLKAGMFVEVRFQAGTGIATGEELIVPSTAVHRLGDKCWAISRCTRPPARRGTTSKPLCNSR